MREDTAKLYPTLDQAMGGYFHQDWDATARDRGIEPSEDGVIRLMIADGLEHEIRATIADIEKLLESTDREDRLERVIRGDMNAEVHPERDGYTMREWLEHVADLHRRSLRTKTYRQP